MPAMSVTAPHTLGKEAAIKQMTGIMERMQKKFPNQVSGIEESWNGNVMNFQFSTYGFRIKGQTTVEESEVHLTGELPFAAVMFKGRIEQSIQDEIVKALQSPKP